MNQQSWIFLIQIFSPVVIIGGILWRVGRLAMLRRRQRDALKALCDEIITLPNSQSAQAVNDRINRIKVISSFYETVVFGGKTPLQLVDEMIKIRTLIMSVEQAWAQHCARMSATSQAEDPFLPYREPARELRSRARLVLHSIL